MPMLVDVYTTTPSQLLNAQRTDFDETQWLELARYLCDEDWNVAYDAPVVCHILSLIGETKVWNSTLAEHFLTTAIFQNDVQTVQFILSHFEHVRANGGCANGSETPYLVLGVENINDKNDQDYQLLDCLLEHFKDPGEALMVAVRWGNVEVVQKLLPHSNPLYQWCFPYRWAQVYNLHEIEQILQPVSDKVHALYGYTIEQWKEYDDQHIAKKREVALRNQLEINMFDEPLANIYTTGLQNALSKDEFENVNTMDLYVLAMLWKTAAPANAKTALEQATLFDDHVANMLVKHFRCVPEVIFPRLSAKSKEQVLFDCAFNDDGALAEVVFAYGVDVHKVHERLNKPSGLLKLLHVSAVAKNLEKRQQAADVLQHWINTWQARAIAKQLEGLGHAGKHSKL